MGIAREHTMRQLFGELGLDTQEREQYGRRQSSSGDDSRLSSKTAALC
jgi:hypothetical protein